MLTGILGTSSSGIIKRICGYDDNNGIYFMTSGSQFYVGLRNNISGAVIDTVIPQSSFNIDIMDGSGPSKVILDLTKNQIFHFDYQWLGVGRVRMGINYRGDNICMHEFYNANETCGVYIGTPNLPIRYEIINSGSGQASYIRQICSTVITDTGQEVNGQMGSNGCNVGISVTTGQKIGVVGIRLKSTYIDTTVVPNILSLLGTSTNRNYRWFVSINPSISTSGSLIWQDGTVRPVEYATSSASVPATITNEGVVLYQGYVSNSNPSITFPTNTTLLIGTDINNKPDELWLCTDNFEGANTFYGAINWISM
jgi:hypothetical protein